MSFSSKIKAKAFSACARHCCVCHRYKGVKMELHHINPKRLLGKNSFENAIPLCFDCHSDAGHYFAKHPKGSKYSPEELKKARDDWYRYVEDNPITEKIEISEDIQTNYYVLHAFDLANDVVFNKNFSSINLYKNQVYLMENEISNFWKLILKTHSDVSTNLDQQLVCDGELFDSVKQYENKYPEARIVDKSGTNAPYYEASREVNWDEFQDNPLLRLLSQTGIDINKFCKAVLYYDTAECAGNPSYKYQECFTFEPISFIFIGITNVSDNPLKLNNLICENEEITLPNFNLGTKEMVLVPISTNFGLKQFNHNSIDLDIKMGERSQTISRVLNPDIKLYQEDTFMTPFIKPRSISFNTNESAYELPVHKINFNNLYSVTRNWECGSCPHLFFVDQKGKQYYQKELLTKYNQGESGENIIEIPKNVKAFIIRELENEITYLDWIEINSERVYSNEKLTKGEFILIEVNTGDIVNIRGHYEPLGKGTVTFNDRWYRNMLIAESNKTHNQL